MGGTGSLPLAVGSVGGRLLVVAVSLGAAGVVVVGAVTAGGAAVVGLSALALGIGGTTPVWVRAPGELSGVGIAVGFDVPAVFAPAVGADSPLVDGLGVVATASAELPGPVFEAHAAPNRHAHRLRACQLQRDFQEIAVTLIYTAPNPD